MVNDTKVFPARLFGKKETGGKAEVFLLELPVVKNSASGSDLTKHAEVTVLIKSSKRPQLDSTIFISDNLQCKVLEQFKNGQMRIELEYPAQFDIMEILSDCGTIPLPPYIEENKSRPTLKVSLHVKVKVVLRN